jgi:hypothetical protein
LGNITALVLVIDALDECDDDDDIRIVIELLAEAQALSGPKVRVLLTSRPEVAIRHGFYDVPDTSHQCFVLHHIASSVVDADIELFLKHNLAVTGREQRLPAGWPGSEVVTKMVQRANGLFIWAATAHRFVRQGRRFAARRLKSVMESDTDTQGEPEKHLDQIYMTILRSSLRPEYSEAEGEEHCKKLRYVLGTLIVLKEPLAAEALEKLLGVVEEGIESIIEDLHAILDIPGDKSRPIRLHHPSLRDFLLNECRCTDTRFWIDEAQIHTVLASRCIALMTSYFKQNGRVDNQMMNRRTENFFSNLWKMTDEAKMVRRARRAAEIAGFVEMDGASFAEDQPGYLRNRRMNPNLPELDLRAEKSHARLTDQTVRSFLQGLQEFLKGFKDFSRGYVHFISRHLDFFKRREDFLDRHRDFFKRHADFLKRNADLLKRHAYFLDDRDFLRGEVKRFSKHPRILERLEDLGSKVSQDDEALYSVELRYSALNWARHFKQSGARPVDYEEAHVFLKEYLLDWQLTLLHYGNVSEEAGNTKYLIDCVTVSLPADVRAQILNAPRKTMLLYLTLSFGRILQNTRKQCGN